VFRVDIGSPDGGTVTVRLVGELDMLFAEDVREAFRRALAVPGVRDIVVDLARLEFLDSSGLSALLTGKRLATNAGVSFGVSSPTDHVRAVLEITGTLEVLAGNL
jgi:anti-sigma B factor antagonist